MPAQALSLEDIFRLQRERAQPLPKVVGDKPVIPVNVTATGERNLIRIQWAPDSANDGYRVAVMTDQNLENPNVGMFVVAGGKALEYVYPTGNNALTRFFAVQAFIEGEFSEFSSVVSATSVKFTDSILFLKNTRTSDTDVTFALPANTLSADGGVEIIAAGVTAGSTATKTMSLKWGSTEVALCDYPSSSNGNWLLHGFVNNRGATNAQICTGFGLIENAVDHITLNTDTVDTTASVDIILDITVNASDDIHIDYMLVRQVESDTVDSTPSSPPVNPPPSIEPPERGPGGTA